MSKWRFVFDTNVIVSALLLEDSKPRKAFDKALDQGRILISLPTLAELSEVLGRTKFDKYVSLEERNLFLATFVRTAEFVEITESITVCRDPKDNKFLELAVNGRASCIISGDRDLLDLRPFRGIPMLTPGEFLIAEQFGKHEKA